MRTRCLDDCAQVDQSPSGPAASFVIVVLAMVASAAERDSATNPTVCKAVTGVESVQERRGSGSGSRAKI